MWWGEGGGLPGWKVAGVTRARRVLTQDTRVSVGTEVLKPGRLNSEHTALGCDGGNS